MPKILIAECKQEISSFNPVVSTRDYFTINRGEELLRYHERIESEICGALQVFAQRSDIELVPTCGARAPSAGPLSHESFASIADELLDALRRNAAGIDGFYFCMHGAMATTGELDPEGFLLREARQILGPEVPIILSLDLHGILTAAMLEHSNGLVLYHTYPHVDFTDTGRRAARLLLRVLDQGARPVVARVRVPALVRGNELITATGVLGRSIRHAQKLEEQDTILAAGMMIGNPFTDVPELCSQAVVVTDNDPDLAAREALQMAEDFWERRAQMQPELIGIDAAIDAARKLDGPVIFTDAADATSSGATGDSNALLAALIEQDYPGRVLLPIVDPPAVRQAHEAGVGRTIRVKLGGVLDPRFTPVELEAVVDMLSRGQYVLESWDTPQNAGPVAVLESGNFTIVALSRAVHLFDRSPFLAHGQDPQRFDLIVVKSPHCQPRFFDEWAERNFNVDAPGSTSANLKTLGHTICQRPMYPLDQDVPFAPRADVFP